MVDEFINMSESIKIKCEALESKKAETHKLRPCVTKDDLIIEGDYQEITNEKA